MRKLLAANFFSLARAKRIWLLGIFMAGMGAFGGILTRQDVARGYVSGLDNVMLSEISVLFLLMPAMAALFINTDYHDGAIRNKLTVGCARSAVYLANLISMYAVYILATLLYTAVLLLFGLGIPVEAPQAVFSQYLMLMLVMLAETAMGVFLATVVSNRSVLVFSVFMSMSMMFGAQIINDVLLSPPMIDDYGGMVMTTEEEDGTVVMQYIDKDGNPIQPEDIPQAPNPGYVRQPWRTVLRTVNQVQPGGQMIEILSEGYQDLDEDGQQIMLETPYWLLAVHALTVTAVFTLAGLLIFKKKDLK